MIAAFCCYKRMPYKMHVYKADIKYWPGSEDRNTPPPGRSLHSGLLYQSVSLSLRVLSLSLHTTHALTALTALDLRARWPLPVAPARTRRETARRRPCRPDLVIPRYMCVEPRMMF